VNAAPAQDATGGALDGPGLVFATPAGWQEIDLSQFLDGGAKLTDGLREQLSGLTDNPGELAGMLAGQAAAAHTEGICFAAINQPQSGRDVTTVTVALRRFEHASPPNGDQPSSTAATAQDVRLELAPDQNAVLLPIGRAARNESLALVDIGLSPEPLPVFSVEYAAEVPLEGDGRFVVLTFTTMAPTNLDVLRTRFAEIASTLASA
jgi:hypothetical protein